MVHVRSYIIISSMYLNELLIFWFMNLVTDLYEVTAGCHCEKPISHYLGSGIHHLATDECSKLSRIVQSVTDDILVVLWYTETCCHTLVCSTDIYVCKDVCAILYVNLTLHTTADI